MFLRNCTMMGGGKIRHGVSGLLAVGIAVAILWALVPIYDPGANLKKLEYKDGTISLQIELTNANHFRGFKYTTDGWVQVFYKPGNGTPTQLVYHYTKGGYQGFGKTMLLDFSLSATLDADQLELLKTQKSSLYVSLYLTYWFKIVVWITKTNYYQWLDVNAYLSDHMILKDVSPFARIKDLSIAMGS